jgi:hypothetical protein
MRFLSSFKAIQDFKRLLASLSWLPSCCFPAAWRSCCCWRHCRCCAFLLLASLLAAVIGVLSIVGVQAVDGIPAVAGFPTAAGNPAHADIPPVADLSCVKFCMLFCLSKQILLPGEYILAYLFSEQTEANILDQIEVNIVNKCCGQ